MTQPRDVPLEEWLKTVGFHPANTPAKQLGFAVTRQAVANLGALLHGIIPPGADKSTAYRKLGDFLMYANRALAVNGGPRQPAGAEDAGFELEESLRSVLHVLEEGGRALEVGLQRDARYEAQQLSDPAPVGPDGDHAGANELERYPGNRRDLFEQQHEERPADSHSLDIPDGTGGHVRVTQAAGYVGVRVMSTTGTAVFRQSDPVSMLLQTISAAGGRAFSDPTE